MGSSRLEIVRRGVSPRGHSLVIEDWGEDTRLPYRYAAVIFAPPTGWSDSSFGPNPRENWRWDLWCATPEEAEAVFSALERGEAPYRFRYRYRGTYSDLMPQGWEDRQCSRG